MQRDFPPAEKFAGVMPGIPGTMVREVESLPDHLESGAEIAPYTGAAVHRLQFEVPPIARYLIREGKTVEVAVTPGADRAAARLFLLGSARGALIHQRGELPLNAATLVTPTWKCIAISSPSAIGKSTLAAALCRRGWLLVADDITRISWNGTMAVAWPSHDALALWRQSCEMLGENADVLERVREGMEKFFLPVRATTSPAALSAVVWLRTAERVEVEEVAPVDRPELLSLATFRQRWIDPLGRRGEYARMVAQVGRLCRCVVLHGARDQPVEELADRVVETFR